MHDLVIENGTVVDGTGAEKFEGYGYTTVSGQVTFEGREATDARPGRLTRGAQRGPA